MSKWSQVFLQDSFSPSMQYLSLFHDYSLSIMSMILFFVAVVSISVITNGLISNSTIITTIELIWTIIPVVVLLFLVIPSLKILYMMEESSPFLSVKVMGHQWYWMYEYISVSFDSYMYQNMSMFHRLLDTDHRVVVPVGKNIRGLISSGDVIHCWTVPSLGFKVDAIPGRLNQVSFNILSPSILYGQCSEICGANHSFMPIYIESISLEVFIIWCLLSFW